MLSLLPSLPLCSEQQAPASTERIRASQSEQTGWFHVGTEKAVPRDGAAEAQISGWYLRFIFGTGAAAGGTRTGALSAPRAEQPFA